MEFGDCFSSLLKIKHTMFYSYSLFHISIVQCLGVTFSGQVEVKVSCLGGRNKKKI